MSMPGLLFKKATELDPLDLPRPMSERRSHI